MSTTNRMFLYCCLFLLTQGVLFLPVSTGHAQPAEVMVRIQKMAFHPAAITVKAGTTVVWKNEETGATYHGVASDEPGGFLSSDFFPGETWRHTFTTPGTYPYHCTPHENRMKGAVIVEP